MSKMIEPTELDFLLRYPAVLNATSPVDFLSHSSWGGIKALSNMEQFRNLDKDIEVFVVYHLNLRDLIFAVLFCGSSAIHETFQPLVYGCQ